MRVNLPELVHARFHFHKADVGRGFASFLRFRGSGYKRWRSRDGLRGVRRQTMPGMGEARIAGRTRCLPLESLPMDKAMGYWWLAAVCASVRGIIETTTNSRTLLSMPSTLNFTKFFSTWNWARSPTGRRMGCLSSLGRIR